MTTVTASAIAHKDVHGRTLYYLSLTNGKDNVWVNVGEKTFNNVKKLEENGEQSEPVQKGGKQLENKK